MTMTKLLLTALQSGKNMTAREITEVTGLANPHDGVRKLRMQGYCIYSNKNGYRMGTPSREVMAAVYNLFGPSHMISR